jgi:hypothetical protein
MVVDANHKRLQSYIEKIKTLVPPVEGLVISSCSNKDFCAVWAAGAWTPVSCICDSKGVGIIFGDAIKGPGSERLTAEQLRYLWNDSKPPRALDGFHAAAVYSPRKGLTIGADLLGIFPIYYYASEEVILVGSSPELFQYHPSFRLKFNPAGFVGILLTNGTFDGQTLLCGVKRLAPGHLLISRPEESVKEALQFKLPISNKYFDLKLSDQAEVLNQALEEAISRHVPKGIKYCLSLSGGLDSRLIGGYLKKNELDVVALTEGLQTDKDMRCAIPVANELGFKHVQFNIGGNSYPRFACLTSKWQHLNTGFELIRYWGYYECLRKIATRVVTGYFGSEILGGLFGKSIPKPAKSVSLEILFRYNGWYSRPVIPRRLLKKEYSGLIPEILHQVKKNYEIYPGLEFQRLWSHGLHHRMRIYVGNIVWLLSFGSWPVLPFADQKVLETVGGMPIEALVNRSAEKELLCRKFPKLARLPLVRVDRFNELHDTTPLTPTPLQRGWQQIIGNGGIWRSKEARYLRHLLLIALRGERRYYTRQDNINSQGWKAVHKLAAPHLKLTSKFLQENVVREFVPSPTLGYLNAKLMNANRTIAQIKGTHIPNSLARLLMGFAIWCYQHHVNTQLAT